MIEYGDLKKLHGSVGEQNLPPQIVSLWHEDLFRLIIFKAPKTQEEPLTFPITS